MGIIFFLEIMYFLSQIKQQFLYTIYLWDSPLGGWWAPSEWVTQDSAVETQEVVTPDNELLSLPEQQLFQELNERLDAIENDSRLVTTYCDILWSFLQRVKNGEVEWLSADDSDFVRLLELYKWRFEELKDLRDQGHSIEHIISQHMWRLNQAVNEWSTGEDITDNIVREHVEGREIDEQQQELERLHIQRDSYEGILREKLSEYRVEDSEWTNLDYELSSETLSVVQEINLLLWEELEGDLDSQIARITAINWLIYGPLNWEGVRNSEDWLDANLNTHLELERELVLKDNYVRNYLDFQMTLTEDREIPQDIQEQFQTIRDREIGWNIQVRTEDLREDNQTLSTIISRLRSELWEITDTERVELDRLRSEYDDTLLLITEKVWPFVWQEGLTRNMELALAEFAVIQQNPLHMDSNAEGNPDAEALVERRSDIEILALLRSGANENLLEVDRLVDIALRDESLVWWEDSERLWDVRETSTNAAYDRILASEGVTEALQDGEWNIPSFEELDMDHILILKNLDVNLAELFLTNTDGSSFSWDITEGNSYIINFGSNTNLPWQMDFAFIARDTQNISVDGTELSFDGNTFKLDWDRYYMMDGSIIDVISNFEDDETPEQTERHEQIDTLMEGYWLSATQNRAVREAMGADNPDSAFEGTTLPGWLGWWLLKIIAELFLDKEFEFVDGMYREIDQSEPLSNGQFLDSTMWQYYDNGQRVDISSSFENLPRGVWPLINTIYQAEANGNPNIIYGGSPIQPPKPITEMTLREVRRFQDRMVSAWSISSAVGAPQIIRTTMDGAIAAWVFDLDEKFDVDAQNRFTIWKMEQRWLNRFMSGQVSKEWFMESLSKEWASLPKDSSGAWYYDGHAWNQALVSYATMDRHLTEIWRW